MKKNQQKKTIGLQKNGFTLIELLMVVSIIALLTALIVASFSQSKKKSRDARRVSDIRTLAQALAMYHNNYQVYPCSDISCNGTEVRITGSDNMSMSLKAEGIINADVIDPLNDGTHRYWYSSAGDTYVLRFCQETDFIRDLEANCNNVVQP